MFEKEVEALFPGSRTNIYMNTASYAIGCAPAADALKAAADAWSQGRFDYIEAEAAGEEARAIFARLINAPAENIALIPTVSAAAGLVATHLALNERLGNIIVSGSEFTSNLFPWRMLERRGWEVRLIDPVDGRLPPEVFARGSDEQTRLIAVSAVQSANGFRVDLPALREIADRSGARLFVDASQIAGALPIDVMAPRIDALAAPSHKFLLGTRGFGYAYFANDLRDAMTPILAGWKAGRSLSQASTGRRCVCRAPPHALICPSLGSMPWLSAPQCECSKALASPAFTSTTPVWLEPCGRRSSPVASPLRIMGRSGARQDSPLPRRPPMPLNG